MKDKAEMSLKEIAQDRMNAAMERADCVLRTKIDCPIFPDLLEKEFSEVLFCAETIQYIEFQKKKGKKRSYKGGKL